MADLRNTLAGNIIIGFVIIVFSLILGSIELIDNPFSYLIDMMGAVGVVSGGAYMVRDMIN